MLDIFFNKVAGLRSANLLKETATQVFLYQFCEIFKTAFFKEYFERLVKFDAVSQRFNVGLQFYVQSLQEQKDISKQTTMK